jgi:hypothetical protein
MSRQPSKFSEAVRLGLYVQIVCGVCRAFRLVAPERIASTIPHYHHPKIEERLRCVECGERRAGVAIVYEPLPKGIDMTVWYRSDVEQRQALRAEALAIARGLIPDPRAQRKSRTGI